MLNHGNQKCVLGGVRNHYSYDLARVSILEANDRGFANGSLAGKWFLIITFVRFLTPRVHLILFYRAQKQIVAFSRGLVKVGLV